MQGCQKHRRVAAGPASALDSAFPLPDRTTYPMPAITLPDGSVRQFDAPVTGTDVAAAIGPGLAPAPPAMKLDGKLFDPPPPTDRDAAIVFVPRRDPEALELIRHDAAHVLAEAVQTLF